MTTHHDPVSTTLQAAHCPEQVFDLRFWVSPALQKSSISDAVNGDTQTGIGDLVFENKGS